MSGPGARDAIASQNEVHQVVEVLFSSGKPLRCLTDTKTAFWRKESLSVRFSYVGSQPTIASRSGTNISADRSFFGKPPGWRWLNVALRVPPTALKMSPDLDSKLLEIMILILTPRIGYSGPPPQMKSMSRETELLLLLLQLKSMSNTLSNG